MRYSVARGAAGSDRQMRAITKAIWIDAKALPSDRSFGCLAAGVAAALGAYGYWKGADLTDTAWRIGMAAGLLAIALAVPELFRPFNVAWFWLGRVLGMVVSPLVLGFIFFAVLSPVALVMRWLGRDELRLRKRSADSYWIARTSPSAESFKNQF